MPELFTAKLQSGQPVCYLNVADADLKMWNFLNSGFPVLNTHLLFKAAARPHFDYFFGMVDFLGIFNVSMIDVVEDVDFKSQILAKQNLFVNPEQSLKVAQSFIKDKSLNTVLITSQQYKKHEGFKAKDVVVIKDRELFGNVEPVWNNIKKQLPANVDLFLLNLGQEKFLIGPRLKLIFNKTVLDIAGEPVVAAPAGGSIKKIIKQLIR